MIFSYIENHPGQGKEKSYTRLLSRINPYVIMVGLTLHDCQKPTQLLSQSPSSTELGQKNDEKVPLLR